MGKLYLMMGIPGSGKSTWCQTHNFPNTVWISRDAIRFSLLEDGEDYFSKETETFNIYMNDINDFLKKGYNVIADATHLNAASRNKVIRNLTVEPDEINVIFIDTPLKIAIERNSKRNGRTFVPEKEIKKMNTWKKLPKAEEGIANVYVIKEGQLIKEINFKEVNDGTNLVSE